MASTEGPKHVGVTDQ